MRRIVVLVLPIAFATMPAHGQAVSAELRGGGAVGNHAPTAAGLETSPGLSVSAAVELGLRPGLSAYLGYTRGSFACEEGFCAGESVTVTSSGVGAGLRYQLGSIPWLRAGLLYHGTDVETRRGSFSVDPAIGYELGAGAAIPVRDRLDLVSGLAYRSHPDAEERTTVVSFEVGVRYRIRAGD